MQEYEPPPQGVVCGIVLDVWPAASQDHRCRPRPPVQAKTVRAGQEGPCRLGGPVQAKNAGAGGKCPCRHRPRRRRMNLQAKNAFAGEEWSAGALLTSYTLRTMVSDTSLVPGGTCKHQPKEPSAPSGAAAEPASGEADESRGRTDRKCSSRERKRPRPGNGKRLAAANVCASSSPRKKERANPMSKKTRSEFRMRYVALS